MSTLWTPSGEHPVPRSPAGGGGPTAGGSAPGDDGRTSAGPARQGDAPSQAAGGPTPEEVSAAEEEMEAVREELLRAPAEVVIANHAMGLWELAALHLSRKPPQLPQAQLAIDALSALVEGLHGRLGEAEKSLADGLTQIRMAFVQIAKASDKHDGAG